jgi:voltage-gated potassium channel
MPDSPIPREPGQGWPPQLTAWERATNLPLLALALLFLVAYAVPILYPGLPAWVGTIATAVYALVWAVYAADFAVRLVKAGRGNRIRFLYTHPLDLLMVVLPMLRPLRVVRIILLLSEVFRRHAEATKRLQAAFYVVAVTFMILLVSSLAILDAERYATDSQVTDFGDALWWSVVTASTVGYGDTVPQTAEGKAIAAFLMFAAIGLVGLVSGSLASWFVDRVSARDAQRQEEAENGIADMGERLAVLERQVAEIHAVLVPDGPPVREPRGVPGQRAEPEH